MKSSRKFSKQLFRISRPVLLGCLVVVALVACGIYIFARPSGKKIAIDTSQPQPTVSTKATQTPKAQQSTTASNTPPVGRLLFTHQNITTTIFWVGEPSDADNGYIANAQSAWDGKWEQDYGGYDNPSSRQGFYPAGFTPKENPFYIALPYNDIATNGTRKPTASKCPMAATLSMQPYSWCKNSWVAIQHNGKVAYAQWEDVGPFEEDDTAYVFGAAKPANTEGEKAGLDVSPAVRDYLGLKDVDNSDWVFVPLAQVPNGPWSNIVTTSLGYTVN